jgi:twitching motility protein PilT
VEVLLCTSRVRELIEDKDRTKEINDAIAQGHLSYGMQTFDQSLMALLKANLITYEEALRQATNRDDFALRLSGVASTSDSKWDAFEATQVPKAQAPAPAAPVQGVYGQGNVRPQQRPAQPQTPAPASGSSDDDFQIERF